MNASELERYKQELVAEHREEIAAVDRLIARERSKHSTTNGSYPVGSAVASLPRQRRPNDIVRETVTKMPGEFTREDVQARITQIFGACPLERQVLTLELWKLANENVLETVSQGRGRTPAVYRRR